MKKKTDFTTMDIYLSAFLTLSGINPKLKVNQGKVVFSFPSSNDLCQLMENFNTNVAVPVVDFTTMVKALRGRMLSMRGRK
jgi:hypothetical protein|tara:strand:+ start:1089 stop:1331 length:243 start_codon:yes stop_codon:yes gene_type:complete